MNDRRSFKHGLKPKPHSPKYLISAMVLDTPAEGPHSLVLHAASKTSVSAC
jgi:hypothetical protein